MQNILWDYKQKSCRVLFSRLAEPTRQTLYFLTVMGHLQKRVA